jgi:hypothetical protein
MDVLTTILTCSLYFADDSLVRAIAESTPDKNPYFVLDASIDLTQVDPPPPPKSSADALARAKDILAKGGRPVLGLMQVPPVWLSTFGRELGDAFDPCVNIAVGTAMLSEFDSECGARTLPNGRPSPAVPQALAGAPLATRRRCVLEKYERAIGFADFAMVTTLELRAQRPLESEVAQAPILFLIPAQGSRPDSLLVPMSASFRPVFASSP